MNKISPQKSLFLGPKIAGTMLPCSPISAVGVTAQEIWGGDTMFIILQNTSKHKRAKALASFRQGQFIPYSRPTRHRKFTLVLKSKPFRKVRVCE